LHQAGKRLRWIMSFDPMYLFLAIAFGLVGAAAWRYGYQQSSIRHLLLATALMGFPYFVTEPMLVLGIGGVLTLFLFWPAR
jgi:hypothetical protein